MNKPLEGIRVLDLTRLLPGGLCSQHLADMGADVIKVEDTGQGDYARNTRGYFNLVNRNKRSMTVDLKQVQGRDIFFKLIKTADVMFEGFRPGVVERLGIDYASVKEVNPRIVYCSLSGYGQDGPYRHRAGHDLNYCADVGITDQIGASDSDPVIPNIQIADFLGGTLSSAMGILAALVDCQRHGRGRYVDVSMADCALAHSIMPMMDFNETSASQPRGESLLSGGLPWYAIYTTSDDKHMALGALEDKFWLAFCEHLNRPDWVQRDPNNGEFMKTLRSDLEQMFRGETQAAWVERFDKVDCCLSPVRSHAEVVEHEHFHARGMLIQRRGYVEYGFPLKFDDFTFEVRREPPCHGENTDEILAELGFSADEVELARASGAI